MTSSARYLNPSEAAGRLGVSAKALRLYERRGLIKPLRTEAGWRAYGPGDMARATEIVALRALGLSLAEVAKVLGGEAGARARALALHQAALETRIRRLTETVKTVRSLRADLAPSRAPALADLSPPLARRAGVGFDLPWPWGGERFELREIRPLTYIVGPLGSGKTRLAQRLAETLRDAVFLSLDRLADGGKAARACLDADPALAARVNRVLTLLIEDGAAMSEPLLSLLAALEGEGPSALVVDMVEQGLDQGTQRAVIAHLRRRGPDAPSLFLMTRSSAILDLAAVGSDETIILCPANHSPPICVDPCPGAPGYEAVATCLAAPDVRARTEGTIAWRPSAT